MKETSNRGQGANREQPEAERCMRETVNTFLSITLKPCKRCVDCDGLHPLSWGDMFFISRGERREPYTNKGGTAEFVRPFSRRAVFLLRFETLGESAGKKFAPSVNIFQTLSIVSSIRFGGNGLQVVAPFPAKNFLLNI